MARSVVKTASKRRALVGGTALLVALRLTGEPVAQQNRASQGRGQPGGAQIQIVPARDNIYVLGGAGANVVLSVGRDGVFMVDTGLAQNADQVLAALQQLQRQLDIRTPQAERFGAEGRV